MSILHQLLKNKFIVKRGQSMVEVAIILPILLLLFIGVFEVGWALRGYLVLSSVNREAARFAVKNRVLDYSVKTITTTVGATVGYDSILSQTLASLGYNSGLALNDPQQRPSLPLNFLDPASNATMIISHYVVDTQFPCAKFNNQAGTYVFDSACNCNALITDTQWFTRDDLILQPYTSGFGYYSMTYGLTQTTRTYLGQPRVVSYTSRVNPLQKVAELKLQNNQLNCAALKTNANSDLTITANNIVIVETFYDQPQLLGLPFVSNALTDPIPMYAQTAMRIVSSREAENTDTVGPTCEVYPLTFPDGALTPGAPIDAFEGGGSGNFGWLSWNGDGSAGYTLEELVNSRLSLNDFTNAANSSDHTLNQDDSVWGNTGVSGSSAIKDQLKKLVNQTIRVPVYDKTSGNGANMKYHISHFALITINTICLPGESNGSSCSDSSKKEILATFVKYDDEACK